MAHDGEGIDPAPGLHGALDALRGAGRHPARALADAVLRYGEAAVEPICALLRAPETWAPEELPETMFPIHLLYLLGCLSDPRATQTLVEAMKAQDLGDHLTEGMAPVLGALGPDAIPSLVPVLLDHQADPFVRNAAGRGLYLLGCAHPDTRGGVASALARVMREADLENPDDFSTAEMLADDVAMTGDDDAVAAVRDAFARGLAGSRFIEGLLLERLSPSTAWQRGRHDAPPIAHFEWESRAPHRIAHRAMATVPRSAATRTSPKVGRNDPCPCGSGKKYKKCCGR